MARFEEIIQNINLIHLSVTVRLLHTTDRVSRVFRPALKFPFKSRTELQIFNPDFWVGSTRPGTIRSSAGPGLARFSNLTILFV